ncbi:MAG: DUF4334 domain-containing protein [Actinobacteria bacterium]|uniref:Unannotated protein n=1 Tax=freshwater metagenome TaxID=449393 RepID=A0A6J6PHP4_9ZZZZ|nr:DUF4334 domain-containing protein [Actinomycetota bacterium]
MDLAAARARFAELRAAATVSPADLDEVWAALPTVRPEEILGAWRGDDFATGHPVHELLGASQWHGKRFDSVLEAHPLICRGEDGELFSNKELGKGLASLWSVEFRGESTATMVYDGQAIFDHFKQVDDRTLMGIMNGKGVLVDGQHYYFLLERD